MLIYEFQREGEDGEWEPLGMARTGTDQLDIGEAVEALRATHQLGPGVYRTRAVEAEHRWHYGEVDEAGEFRLIDMPTGEMTV